MSREVLQERPLLLTYRCTNAHFPARTRSQATAALPLGDVDPRRIACAWWMVSMTVKGQTRQLKVALIFFWC